MDREYTDWIFDQQCAEDDRLALAREDAWTGPAPVMTPAQSAAFRESSARIQAQAKSEALACSGYIKAIDPYGPIAYEMGRDPGRRLFQVRQAAMVLHLSHADCVVLEEFADNLEKRFNIAPKRAPKGN